MFKKTLASALLVCTVPAMASGAWFLTTKVTSVGGNLSYNYNGTTGFQTYTSGAKTKSLDANGAASVSVAADAHNSIKSVTVTKVDKDGNQTVNTTAGSSVTFSPADGDNFTVWANFQIQALTATASITNGAVSPSSIGNLYYGYQVMSDLTFNFTPKVGYTLGPIQNNGVALASGGYVVVNNATKADQRASVTFKKGYVFTAPIALSAAGAAPANMVTFSTSAPQNAAAGSESVTLKTTAANVGTISWYYVSGPQNTVAYSTVNGKVITTVTPGPAVLNGFTVQSANQSGVSADKNGATGVIQNVLGGPTGANVTLTIPAGSAPGQYKFLAQATGIDNKVYSSIATVNVVAQASDVSNQCQFCHTANGIAGGRNIGAEYQLSVHGGNSQHSSCAACHFGGTAAGHPGDVTTATVSTTDFTVKVAEVTGPYGKVTQGNLFCNACHSGGYAPSHGVPYNVSSIADANQSFTGADCKLCHTATGTGDAHNILGGCVNCHSVPRTNFTGLVADNNNGVRAVADEFKKWSHHIVNANGIEAQDAQCAVCHLEGQAVNSGIHVDYTKHMKDNKIHLRNSDTDADFAWDPANPDHSGMDNFCMSCHDTNGATSAGIQAIQTVINANGNAMTGKVANAGNPFGDTISNRYDKMMRPAVTNVDSQFDTNNNSHHGVKGARYTGRTRTAGPRQIASAATFAANSTAALQGIRSTMYDAGNFNGLYVPLENAGGETAPRTGAQSLGDDSTLHCGDCHTVGQWKVGSSKNIDGSATTAAIGAHGSNNEYMLRNSIGTDERHVGVAYTSANNVVTVKNPAAPFLVCYNCHTYNKYGSVFVGTGADAGNATFAEMGNIQPHAGEYASAGRCNGPGNTISFNGYTTGTATDGTQFESRFAQNPTAADAANGFQNPDFGNIFGIQCLNCHNSGAGNAYGGIHGSANDTDWATVKASDLIAAAGQTKTTKGFYVDGMGNANSVQRFLPGLGNVAHVPGTLGGFFGGSIAFQNGSTANSSSVAYTTGGVSKDTNWEQKHWQQKSNTVINYKTAAVSNTLSAGAGCYTLGASATAVAKNLEGPSVTGNGGAATELLDTWGGCEDHGAAKAKGDHGFLKRIVRPVTY
ncbi:hypothetical protein [Geomesophilobacter sediminis]|uniref:Cytochrome C n=1 Tax=Geomesophilobacter sediminis TaxID=2798584 RepID=A0A8J7M244_9BACT|nr:hypothetical protein [Geomesophilobacter sediminis]MBJ6727272.1 hypothetical protein [Geomesophilobacter sediminis]